MNKPLYSCRLGSVECVPNWEKRRYFFGSDTSKMRSMEISTVLMPTQKSKNAVRMCSKLQGARWSVFNTMLTLEDGWCSFSPSTGFHSQCYYCWNRTQAVNTQFENGTQNNQTSFEHLNAHTWTFAFIISRISLSLSIEYENVWRSKNVTNQT